MMSAISVVASNGRADRKRLCLTHREHGEIRRNTQAKTPQAKTLAPTEETR